MATSLICKVSFNAEIRRFTCKVENMTYAAIHKRAKEILNLDTPFKFQYTDDEGDVITMSTEEEMAEAVGLALSADPAVLRLTVKIIDSPDAKPPPPLPSRTVPPPAQPCSNAPPAEAHQQPHKPDLSGLLKNIEESLPALMQSLPSAVRNLIPSAELDLAATMAANAAANASCAAAEACAGHRGYGDPNVHPGVSCDKSGMCPIVGNRYHLVGHNYDLCEAEFLKLSAEEQAKFEKIAPPFGAGGAKAQDTPGTRPAVHLGVTCDKSGKSPIVGNRYHLIGHNYDLCEAEFLKLSAEEQAKFEKIPVPMPRCGGRWARGGSGHHHYHHGHSGHKPSVKPSARFVCDVAVFDGTQVAPNTPFTKIWRLKNVGDSPWPPGTKMLFVGGDQMGAEITVPLTSRVVLPGEECDVAVDMIAPADIGRYIGYWRLQGPHGRRFGQRVWCHIQVVDPKAPHEDDFQKVQEEISSLMAKVTHDDDDDAEAPAEPGPAVEMKMEASAQTEPEPKAHTEPGAKTEPEPEAKAALEPVATGTSTSDTQPIEGPQVDTSTEQAAEMAIDEPIVSAPEAALSSACSSMDDTVLVESDPEREVAIELLSMGFTDEEMIEHIIEKNGPDLEACARDLVSLNEWDTLLSDLHEMGFQNSSLNKKLMIKHNGSVKRTVKDLVAENEF